MELFTEALTGYTQEQNQTKWLESVSIFVEKIPEYSTNNPVVYILYSLFAIFINILNILFDIDETRDVWLNEEYRWNGTFSKKIQNIFKLIKNLLTFLYSWIPASDPLKKSIILFLIFYYPPGRWMLSIICEFLLCFTGVNIQEQLFTLREKLFNLGWQITDFFCAIKFALENLPRIVESLNELKNIAPALKDATNALVTTGNLVASTGEQVADIGQQLVLAKNTFIIGVEQFKNDLLPLLATAGVGATCQIPEKLQTYIEDQGNTLMTNIIELSQHIQSMSGRVTEIGDSNRIDFEDIKLLLTKLGYTEPSTFETAMGMLTSITNKAAFQAIIHSEEIASLFTGRQSRRLEFGGQKTRRYKKYIIKGSKTRKNRRKKTQRRKVKKNKKARKSKNIN